MGVTRDEDIKLGYLFDPIFQAQNTAGKPLSGGYVECYYHGTRTKYFCFSDFNRTLHPFRIPLDSLGSNIILADVAFSYDVYIYNRFGSLVMSRYDVKPRGTGSSESASGMDDLPEYWLGQYGGSINIPGDMRGVTLPLPSVPDYHGDFVESITNTDGNQPGYMYLKPGLYFVKCVIRFEQDPEDIRNEYGEVLLYTGNGNANECRAWRRDISGPDCPAIDGEYDTIRGASFEVSFIRRVLGDGETSSVDTSNTLYFAPSTTVNWKDAFIQNLQIVKLNSGGGSSKKYAEGEYISIVGDVISATGLQPAGDYVTPESMAEYFEENTSAFITSAEVEESYVDKPSFLNTINDIEEDLSDKLDSSAYTAPVQSDWNESDSGSLSYIKNKPEIPSLDGYATQDWVNEQGFLKEVPSEYVTDEELESATSGLQPSGNYLTPEDLDGYATESWVNEQGFLTEVPSQYVTDQELLEATSGKLDSSAYEPPVEYSGGSHIGIVDHEISVTGTGILRAGTGINIEEDASGWIISSSGGGGGGSTYTPGQYISIQNDVISATGLQPSGNYLVPSDLNGYATQTWVGEQGYLTEVPSQYVTDQELTEATSGKLDSSSYVSPVQSDWNQNDSGALDYIKNKPTIPSLDGYATESWVNEQGFLTEVPSQYATDAEVEAATSGKLDSSAYTAPVQSDWNQSNSAALDYIKNKPTIPSAQIQSDWDQSNSAAVDYIKNKPQEEAFTTGELLPGSGVAFRTSGDSTFIDCSGAGVQSDWTESDSSEPDFIKNKPDLVNIIAGPGIVVDNPDGNTLRVSMDSDYEVTLWDGNGSTSDSVTLSENAYNFKYIELHMKGNGMSTLATVIKIAMDTSNTSVQINWSLGNNSWYVNCQKLTISGTTITVTDAHAIHGASFTSTDIVHESNTTLIKSTIFKVVGIGRISGGN